MICKASGSIYSLRKSNSADGSKVGLCGFAMYKNIHTNTEGYGDRLTMYVPTYEESDEQHEKLKRTNVGGKNQRPIFIHALQIWKGKREVRKKEMR